MAENPLNPMESELSPRMRNRFYFGLKWSCYQIFGIIFDKDSINKGNPLSHTNFEGIFFLSYEFLHFFPDFKDQKAFIFAEFIFGYLDFLDSNAYTVDTDFSLGLKYSAKGITPAVGMHIWADHEINNDRMLALGLYLGIEYKIGKFKLNAIYIGGDDILSPDFQWESLLSTGISYSL